MSASITIPVATLGGSPSSNITATVSYRECGSADPWTTVTTGAIILPNGNFQTPVVISGLDEATCYEVRVTNNCDGEGVTQNVTTASLVCPGITDMDAETSVEDLP